VLLALQGEQFDRRALEVIEPAEVPAPRGLEEVLEKARSYGAGLLAEQQERRRSRSGLCDRERRELFD
jgi:hypothetical protein